MAVAGDGLLMLCEWQKQKERRFARARQRGLTSAVANTLPGEICLSYPGHRQGAWGAKKVGKVVVKGKCDISSTYDRMSGSELQWLGSCLIYLTCD